MKNFALATLLMTLPCSAFAASATDPVQRIIDIATARWASSENDAPDYFDKIERDFSKSFIKTYREAQKHPAYDEGDSPFDYDVITSSQDGCPLKDIKVEAQAAKADVTLVEASFKLMTCAEDDASRNTVSELKFDVITEDGKPVINDVHRKNDGKWDSLVENMNEIIKAGQ
jgi:hypothetical protein